MPYATAGVVASSVTLDLPLTIPNCVLWLDADDASTFNLSGASVTQWRDKSPSGYNAVQGVTTPTRVLGTMKAGRYSVVGVTGSYMGLPSGSQNHKPFSVFAAVRFGTDVTYRSILGSDVNGMQFRINNVHKHSLVKANVVEIGVGTNALATATNHIVGVTYTAAGVYTFYNANTANGTATNNQTFTGGGSVLMASAAENWIGSIGEIVKYSRDVTTAERNALYTHLSGRWI